MANQRIDIDVGLKIDKTGLNQIKSSLQEIKNLTAQDLMKIGGHTDIQKAEQELKSLKTSINQIDGALEKAFNTDLGTLNVSKFNQALKGMNLNQVYKDFSAAGAAGQSAFRNITSQILTTNMQLKQTHNFLNNMATTMANTVKWGVASSVMNNFTGSVQKAYGYVKSLDTSLNDIRIVTGKSADEMERFATKANNAAKELGKSTTDYTKASLIYYQQGLSDEDVAARAETTLKAANVTGQSGEAVSEQLTAVWNGYKVSAEEAELYIDKLAAVAATTASDLEELSTGMSKVASAADLMGVDIDQLNAQMATIVSVTRQAPESVGTALKTIYARMGDIEAGLDAETTLGHYTEEMKAMGVNVLDANGKLRDMGSVIEEIGGKWQDMTREQQIALSQTMAGTRQYNNLLSLFDNWDMYTDALNTSANAAGTLQKQQDIYMESTQAHLNQLRAASEDLYDSLLDPKGLNPLIDGLTTVTNLFANFVDSIGGGGGALLGLGAIGLRVFSTQIATGLTTTVKNLQGVKYNAEQVSAAFQVLNQFKGLDIKDETTQKIIKFKEEILQLGSLVTSEQHNEANALIKSTVELKNQAEAWEKNKANAEAYLQKSNISDQSISGLKKDDTSTKNMETLLKAQEDRYQNAEKNSQRYRQSLEELDVAIIELGRAEEKYAAGSAELANAENKTAEALQKVKGNMSTVQDSTKTMLGLLDSQSQEYKELTTAINEYNNVKNSGEEIAIQEAATKVVNAYSNAAKRIQSDTKNTREIIRQEVNGASQDFQNSIVNAENTMSHFSKSLQITGQINNIVKGISSLGSAAMALNSLSNIKNIISNETLSNSEKMLQIMMSLSMAAPILGTNIGNLVKNFGAAKDIMVAKTAVTKAETQMLMLEQSQIIANAAAEGAAQKVKEAGNNKKKRRIALRELNIAKTNQQTIATELEAAAQAKEAATQQLANAEEKKSIGIKLALLAIQNPLATALGVGIVAAIGASIFAWQQHNKAVKESVETLKESVSDLESSASELENLESSLKGVQDQLDELYSKGELSITDKEDIANLEKERIELETQLELQKQINAEKQKQTALDAQDALNKGAYDYESKKEQTVMDVRGNQSVINIDSEESRDAWVEGQVARYGERFREQAEQLANSYYEKYHGEMTSQMMEDLDTLKSSLDAAKASGLDETAAELQAKIEEVYSSTGMLDDTVLSSMNAAFQGDTTQQSQFHEALQSGDPTAGSGWTDEDLEKAGLAESQIEALKAAADAAGISLDTLVNTYKELGNEEIAGTFENNLSKIRAGVEGAGVEYDRGSVMRPSMEGVATSTLHQLQDEYGVDDNFMNKALENLDYSKIDYNNFREGFELALRQAIESQQNAEALSEQELFTQDTEEKGAKYAEEYGIDEEQFENVTKLVHNSAEEFEGFSEELKENGEAAQEVAKELLRYDKALEDVSEHYEDWMDILEGDNLQDQADIIDDLSDAYGNLLDMDGSQLSAGFLTSTKNLELMKEAANGSEEAYKSLQEAAGQDILAQVGIDTSQYATDLAEINNMAVNAENQGLADVEAGASLDDTDFLAALSRMVTSAGMTAAQATNYLSSMGIDAEVETKDQTVSEVVGHNVRAHTFTTYQTYSPGANPDGSPMTSIATYPEVMYSTEPITVQKRVAGTGLRVTSANKSSGGGVKFNNSSHGGGSKGGGKKSGGGGGGKKGGGSTPTKTYKQSAKTKNRYHDVDNKLSKLTNDLDKLTEAQDRLFGSDLLKNLNKQLDVIERQVSATKEKLQIARAEAKEMRKQKLKNQEPGYYNDFKDFGVNFNSSGEITNALDLMAKWDDEVEYWTNKWNSLSAKQQEGSKGEEIAAELEKAEANRDTLNKLIEDYNDLIYDTIPGLESEIQEQASLQLDIKLRIFQIEAELRLDLTEAYEEWYDFKQELLDFKMFEDYDNKSGLLSAEAAKLVESSRLFRDEYKKLTTSGLTETLTSDLETLEAELRDIRKHPKTYDGQFAARDDNGNILKENGKVVIDQQAILDAMGGSISDLEEHLTNVKGVQQDLFDNLLESIDLLQESYEQQYETLEFVGDQIDYNLSMMELMDPENYAGMAEYYQAAVDNAENMVQSTRSAMNYYKQQMERDDITEEEREKFRELYMQSANDFQEALAEKAEIIQNQFKNSLEAELKAVREVSGIEKAEMKWELEMDKDDDYLDTVEAAFERQSFINEVNKQINETDSLSAQKKLNDLLDDELDKLAKKDKLTQYDIDRANKKLELELKRIALEEAQNNKSQMRLRRDSSGNYSYQFVADEDSKAQAEQEFLDAQNSLYNMDKEEMQVKSEELLEIERLHQESVTEYYSLGESERAALAKEYQAKWDYYNTRKEELAKELNGIETNLAESTYESMKTLYEADSENFSDLTDKQIELLKSKHETYKDLSEEEKTIVNEEMLPTWTDALKQMRDAINSNDPEKGLKKAWEKAMGNIKTANENCSTQLNNLKKQANTTYNTAKTKANEWYQKQKQQTKEIKTSITNIRNAKLKVDELAKAWQSVYEKATAALKSAQDYKNFVTKKEADKVGESKKNGSDTKDNKNNKDSKDTKTSNNDSKKTKLTDEVIDGVAGAIWYWSPSAWGVGDERKKKIKEKFGSGAYGKIQGYINEHVSGSKLKKSFRYGRSDRDKYKKYYYSKFDTGGYTGNWPGNEGKMAMLHSKELVLNKDDTENLLAVISILRDFQFNKNKNSSEEKNAEFYKMLIEMLVDIAKSLNENTYLSKKQLKEVIYLNKLSESELEKLEQQIKLNNKDNSDLLSALSKIRNAQINIAADSMKVMDKMTSTVKSGDSVQAKKSSNSLETTDNIADQVSKARNHLYKIRTEEFANVLQSLDNILSTESSSKSYLKTIKNSMVSYGEILNTISTNVNTARKSLYNLRHTDFNKLLNYLETGKVVKSNVSSSKGIATSGNINSLKNSLIEQLEKINKDIKDNDKKIEDKIGQIEKAIYESANDIIQNNISSTIAALRTRTEAADALPVIMANENLIVSQQPKEQMIQNVQVDINADFPNVESMDEITEAFLGLINEATQHAYENSGRL